MSVPDLNEALEAVAEACVQKHAATMQRPPYVCQRNCDSVTGLPGDVFLELARDGTLPSFKNRRLIFVKTADVIAWIEANPVTPRVEAATPEATALARVGARRVG